MKTKLMILVVLSVAFCGVAWAGTPTPPSHGCSWAYATAHSYEIDGGQLDACHNGTSGEYDSPDGGDQQGQCSTTQRNPSGYVSWTTTMTIDPFGAIVQGNLNCAGQKHSYSLQCPSAGTSAGHVMRAHGSMTKAWCEDPYFNDTSMVTLNPTYEGCWCEGSSMSCDCQGMCGGY